MATSVKKERSRRTSWLSPMWRDIDSLRKQNESTKKEIESMRRKSKQTETESEQLRSKSKQIEIETEQLRSETEILKRQNKALELIESSDFNALLREATIPGGNDSDHPEAQLDLELLEEKLVALGCDVDDVPFLFDVLELNRVKCLEVSSSVPFPGNSDEVPKRELIPIYTMHSGILLAKSIELEDHIENTGAAIIRQAACKTNDAAGDGTATSVVLAHAMVKAGLRKVATGANARTRVIWRDLDATLRV